jgi:hypothetical protein
MSERPEDRNREQRIEELAARVSADGQAAKPAQLGAGGQAAKSTPSRKPPGETQHPKVRRATEQLQRIERELEQLEQTLKGEPVVAALVQSIQHRIKDVAYDLLRHE